METTIDKRSIGRSCPYCTNKKVGYVNSHADQYPDVAKLWYQSGNGSLTPCDVVYGSGKKVCWCCVNGPIHKTAVVFATTAVTQCGFCPSPGRGRKYTTPNQSEFDK
jgi:hypothetical protein